MKDLEDLFRVKEPDERFLGALLGDGENALSELTLVGVEEADHFGEGLDSCEPLIAGSGRLWRWDWRSSRKARMRSDVICSSLRDLILIP